MGQKITLADLVIQSNINKRFQYSGIDSIDACANRAHFLSYPHNIEYTYNSRGFRDQEWPESQCELRDAVWCVGDSFTVGLGSPFMHTWPQRVSAASDRRTVNVSMDGASNDWIIRVTEAIAKEVNPTNIIIMWSYTHRRERSDSSLSSELRRLPFARATVEDDWQNFSDCRQRLGPLDSNIVEFVIPHFHATLNSDLEELWQKLRGESWPPRPPVNINELNNLPTNILAELENVHGQLDYLRDHLATIELLKQQNIIPVELMDLARDAHHFDIITADWVAELAVTRLV